MSAVRGRSSLTRWPWTPLVTIAALSIALVVLPPSPPAPVAVVDVQPPHQWQSGVLRVGIDTSYAPFAYEENGRLVGHDVELSRRLADHLGRRLDLVNIPFDGLYDALRVSRIDVIVSALPRLEEMQGAVIYSRPYFEAGEVLVTRTGVGIRDMNTMRGRRVGAELGSLGDQSARRTARERGFTLDSSFVSLEAALSALHDGRIDAIAVDRVSALLQRRRDPRLIIVEPPLVSAPYVVAMPFDDPAFAEMVDRWFAYLESTGQLRQLEVEYVG